MLYWTEIAPVFDFVSGFDKITGKILNTYASLMRHPLSFIYNHSLYTGNFPDCLKIAVVDHFTIKETKLV
jgi:hypothetical protein